MNKTRRFFCLTGALALAKKFTPGVIQDVVANLATEGIETGVAGAIRLVSNFAGGAASGSPMSPERSDLLYHLFIRSGAGNTVCEPARRWAGKKADTRISTGQMTYGHEASVCNAMETFLKRDLKIEHYFAKTQPKLHGNVSRVVLGSGASNAYAAKYLGEPERPLFGTSTCRLRYGIAKGKGTLKRKQYGEEVERGVHVICNSALKPLYHADGENGYQIDDYLLVTRLPGEEPGTSVTMFTGLQGPGTRAAELLFSEESISMKDLRTLEEKIGLRVGRTPYFQAVFRAKEFDPDSKSDTTDSDIATALELVVDKCPPVHLKIG